MPNIPITHVPIETISDIHTYIGANQAYIEALLNVLRHNKYQDIVDVSHSCIIHGARSTPSYMDIILNILTRKQPITDLVQSHINEVRDIACSIKDIPDMQDSTEAYTRIYHSFTDVITNGLLREFPLTDTVQSQVSTAIIRE